MKAVTHGSVAFSEGAAAREMRRWNSCPCVGLPHHMPAFLRRPTHRPPPTLPAGPDATGTERKRRFLASRECQVWHVRHCPGAPHQPPDGTKLRGAAAQPVQGLVLRLLLAA